MLRLAAFLAALLGFAAGLPASAQAQADDTHTVRVRILERARPNVVAVEALDERLTLYAGNDATPLAYLAPGETAGLAVRGRDVYVQLPDRALFATTLRIEPLAEAAWQLHVHESATSAETARYTGRLEVAPEAAGAETLELVNDVPVEDYVASVVASEYGLGDLEGTKAMAVVARTYAVRAAAKFENASYDHVDHTASQMYGGVSTVTPLARRAVAATQGEILTYGGAPIEAVYSSSSGGHTANNEDVWDASEVQPYLRGKPDPYDEEASPHARWTARVDRSRLLRRLSDRFGFTVRGFVLGDRSADGRVMSVELIGPGGRREEMQSNAFRLFVNQQASGNGLRSTLFDAERSGSAYVFEGRGFGHGVGLSQYGAHAMARRGSDYREILAFYYDGTQIERLDGTRLPPPAVATETPRPREPRRTTSSDRRIGW